MRSIDRAARRSGFDQADGKFGGILQRDDPAAGVHQEDVAAHAFRPETVFEAAEIGIHERLDVGIGQHGVETLVFAHLRADLGRERHHGIRHPFGQNLSNHRLMRIVDVGVDESDGDALEARLGDPVNRGLDFGPVQGDQHVTARTHPLANGESHLPRRKRLGQVQVQVILLEPRFGAHFDDVAKSLGRDQRRPCPPALDNGIGRQRRAVNDLPDGAGANPGLAACLMHAVDDRVLRGRIGGKNLGQELLAFALQHDVGKGPADVNAESDGARSHVVSPRRISEGLRNHLRMSQASERKTQTQFDPGHSRLGPAMNSLVRTAGQPPCGQATVSRMPVRAIGDFASPIATCSLQGLLLHPRFATDIARGRPMPMQAHEIEALLRERFPNATIQIGGDDGVHMSAMVIDESFRGMNRVEQQRAVYAALKGRMDGPNGELHALALTTRAPE